jgi:hypothetical protein
MFGFINENPSTWGVLFFFFAAVALALTRTRRAFLEAKPGKQSERKPLDPEIEPLWDFDFRTTDPIKYQPYKTQGHVTMGKSTLYCLQNSIKLTVLPGIMKRVRSEWIRMDKGYLARIEERLPLIRDKPELTLGTGPKVNPAIKELYEEIMIRHLPARYPTMFERRGELVKNLATGTIYPLATDGLTHEQMLAYLGENVEVSFLLPFHCIVTMQQLSLET